jgi:hypothetical protein
MRKQIQKILLASSVSLIAYSANAQEGAKMASPIDVSIWKSIPVSEDNAGVAELKSVKESNQKSYVIETEGFHGRPATQKYFLDQLQNKLLNKTKLEFGKDELGNFIFAKEVSNLTKVELFAIVKQTRIEVLNKVRTFGSSENAEIAFGGEVKKD